MNGSVWKSSNSGAVVVSHYRWTWDAMCACNVMCWFLDDPHQIVMCVHNDPLQDWNRPHEHLKIFKSYFEFELNFEFEFVWNHFMCVNLWFISRFFPSATSIAIYHLHKPHPPFIFDRHCSTSTESSIFKFQFEHCNLSFIFNSFNFWSNIFGANHSLSIINFLVQRRARITTSVPRLAKA